MKKALFYEKHGSLIKCNLCPNYCLIPTKKTGKCRKRVNYNNVLYTENYCKTISMQLDPMRKKPLYYFNENDEILSLGANSCNLTCLYCQNYTSSQLECATTYITPKDLLKYCQKNKIKHVAFTFTEPFTWFEFIYESAQLLYYNQISTVLITNGYVNKEPLEFILPYISAMNIDLKAFTEHFYVEICGGHLQPVLDTIRSTYSRTHIEITFLMIENLNDNIDELFKMFSFIRDLNPDIPLHISKYFPNYLMTRKTTSSETINRTVDIAKTLLHKVHTGNIFNRY